MKLIRRAKLLTLSALLPFAVLATGLATAAPAHAASSCVLVDPYRIYVGGTCTHTSSAPNYLWTWGWNFRNGEKLTIRFYDDGRAIGSPISTTANQAGLLGGYFAASISYSPAQYHQYTASATEPDKYGNADRGFTQWAAAPPVTC